MKTTFAVTALLLLAPTALASHGEPDGDIFPHDVEHAICGFPALKNAINTLPDEDLHCADTGDLQPGVLAAPTPCASCTSTDLLPPTPVPVFPGLPAQPIFVPDQDIPSQGEAIGTIEGYYNAVTDHYCIAFTPTDGDPVPTCVDAVANDQIPPIPPTPIGQTPEIEACSILCTSTPPVPAVALNVHVYYLHDDGMLHERASVGTTALHEPVDLDNAGAVTWWQTNAEGTSLVVVVEPVLDGVPQGPITAYAPLMGQVVAAQVATVESLPEP